MESYI